MNQPPASTAPADAQMEIEHKFDVPPGVTLPDLADVDGIAEVTEPIEIDMEATYFDTEDLRLAARGVALRRRTGGKDQGWHLKVRLDGARRSETWLPLNAGVEVPAVLAREVRAIVRGHDLRPVAVLRTTRVERRLVDGEGCVVALLADDTVRSDPIGSAATRNAWREVEVELVGQDPALPRALSRWLEEAGLSRSGYASKLERALGRGPGAPWSGKGLGGSRAKRLDARSTAGEVVLAYLREQVDELLRNDPAARRDEPDAVHRMRVAARRLRSTLRTFRPLLDRVHADSLRQELRWLGTALGGPRDAEVLRERLHELLAAQPPELVTGPVVERVDSETESAHRHEREVLLTALDDERYLQLLDALDALIANPPLTVKAYRRAVRELPRLVHRGCRSVVSARSAAAKATSEIERLRQLHDVRKAAKRVRYAGECAAPVLGDRAACLTRMMRAVQEVLGEYQDSVVARTALRELGRRAHQAGEDGFTFGLLYGLEAGRGQAAQRAYRRAVRAVSRRC